MRVMGLSCTVDLTLEIEGALNKQLGNSPLRVDPGVS